MLNDITYPILPIMEKLNVHLKKPARNPQGLCPLHNDKSTYSLTVYPKTNSWCCFGAGCGDKGKTNGGDVVEFVKQYFHYNYREALKWLEDNFASIPYQPIPKPLVVKKEKPKVLPPNNVVYWNSLGVESKRIEYFYRRGFKDKIIKAELWGWDGERYTIPVWEGEPSNSNCLGVRRRKSELSLLTSPKYIGLTGYNNPTIWGRFYCQDQKTVLAFAGELDAARAIQDGFPAFSLVNGIRAADYLKENEPTWPELYFPKSKNLIVIFDKKEESFAGNFAHQWNKIKGSMMAKVFQWSPDFNIKDYCEFRDTLSSDKFVSEVKFQTGVKL